LASSEDASVDSDSSRHEWIIDLHGLREAIRGSSNSVIAALDAGTMTVRAGVVKQLQDIAPDEYSKFQSLVGRRRYLRPTLADFRRSQVLLEMYGATVFGPPDVHFFEVIAICLNRELKVVSTGKAYDTYRKILKKCGLDVGIAQEVKAFGLG
jgi:hypothetical protein